MWKPALWFAMCMLLLTVPCGIAVAQQVPSSDPQRLRAPSQRTFRSPSGTFQFAYPQSFHLHTGSEAAEAASRVSYIPVCRFTVIACVIYPESKYTGTNFQGAAFQVREVEDATTAKACLTPRPVAPSEGGWIAAKDTHRIINGVSFLHGENTGAALGHSMSIDVYRAFHERRCYELSINLTRAPFANFEPGAVKGFTTADEQRVHDDLEAILNSFRFLK